MACLGSNRKQIKRQRQILLQQSKRKQNYARASKIFQQNVEIDVLKKLVNGKPSLNFKVELSTVGNLIITSINVNIYIKVLSNISIQVYNSNVNGQSKALRPIHQKIKKNMSEQEYQLNLRQNQSKKDFLKIQYDQLKKMANQAQEYLKKKKIQPNSSDSSGSSGFSGSSGTSGSNGSINSIKQSLHLYQECSCVIYLTQKICPVKLLIEESSNAKQLSIKKFGQKFIQIKNKGFNIQQYHLYFCDNCKQDLLNLNNVLKIIDTNLRKQQKEVQFMSERFKFFLSQLQSIRRGNTCFSNNLKIQSEKNKNNFSKKVEDKVLVKIQEEAQVKVQEKVQTKIEEQVQEKIQEEIQQKFQENYQQL